MVAELLFVVCRCFVPYQLYLGPGPHQQQQQQQQPGHHPAQQHQLDLAELVNAAPQHWQRALMQARSVLIEAQQLHPGQPPVVDPLPSGAGSAGEGRFVASLQLKQSCGDLDDSGNQHISLGCIVVVHKYCMASFVASILLCTAVPPSRKLTTPGVVKSGA